MPEILTRFSFESGEGPISSPRLPRISCSIAVFCTRPHSSAAFPGLVNNVSLGGVRLEIDERLKKGDELAVEFRGRGRRPVPCIVQWCRRLPRQNRMQAGLKLAMPVEDLHDTWLVEILETLGYIQVLNVESREPGIVIEPQDLVLLDTVPEPDSGNPEAPELEPVRPALVDPEPVALEEPKPVVLEAMPLEEAPAAPIPADSEAPTPEPAAKDEAPAPETPAQAEPPAAPAPQVDVFLALVAEAQGQVRNRERPPLLRRVLDGLRAFAVQDGASLYDRRQVARVLSAHPMTVKMGREALEVTTVDLSPVGVAVYAKKVLRRGTVLSLLPPQALEFQGTQAVQATVRYTRVVGGAQRIGLILDDVELAGSWVTVALQKAGFCRIHLDQKRKYVRARTNLPVEARSWRGDFVQGVFLDVGRGGALLRSPTPWQTGEQVRLIVGPLGSLPLLYLAGQVVHQRPEGEESTDWLVSVRFVELDSTKIRRLDQYILALLSVE